MKKDIIGIVQNSKVTHSIAKAATKGNRYWTDFLAVIEDYKKTLSDKDFNNFLYKSRLDREISMAQYLQFSTEVTIVDYIIRNYGGFKNEPKYNDKKNPECSFEYKGRTVNIEVKCPDIFKRIEQEDSEGIKLFAADRLTNKDIYIQAKEFIELNIKDGQRIQVIDRMDNKQKDYLISAHHKFPISNASNFNILVIAVDILSDMDEWYSYLFGESGAFTNNTYIADSYSNVDAVLLTNVQHGHMSDDVDLKINCWQMENYVSLLFLDPRKQDCYGMVEYYGNEALDLFGGLTRDFISYQWKLDKNNDKRENNTKSLGLDENQKKELNRLYYTGDKIFGSHIISEWVKQWKR